MSVFALQFAEQLQPAIYSELDQILGSVQAAFARREVGSSMGLTLGLQFREELPQVVADELDQLVAALQTAYNSSLSTFIKSYQEVDVTIAAGATTGTASIPIPTVKAFTELRWLGTRDTDVSGTSSGFPLATGTLSSDGMSIQAQRVTSDPLYSTTLRFGVTEYFGGVLRQPVQYGEIILDTLGTASATILAVGAKAILGFCGQRSSAAAGGSAGGLLYTLTKTSATQVTATNGIGISASTTRVTFCMTDFR